MTAVVESNTPAWLLAPEPGLCQCGRIGRRTKESFLAKTLRGGSALLRQVMFSDELAARDGLLQRIDARAKLLGLLGLLLAAGFVHTIPALLAAYGLALALAAISGLSLGFYVKRVWLFVPIFTGIVVLPATLSVVVPGDVVLTLWHWNGESEGITAQGLYSAALLVLRVAVSISFAILLTLTTSWSRLLAGLRGLGVPRIFILVIGMAYRYLFHLLTTVLEMYEARTARSAGKIKHDKGSRAFVGATAGALIGRSHQLAEEVHQAMTARGFRGDAKTLDRPRFGRLELCWLTGSALAAGLLLGGDLLVR